ncbi:MerR family transcriptional regulator [Candidatus Babeliales bacterium]|nr:MerR family transcriptional regulator [Candidatus Babeliales bacterium]
MRMQKRQFRIGELAEYLGVERFVIRFWEKEFNLRPTRSEGGQRFYEERDLERMQKIKQLLYEEGFTIAGAKKALKSKKDKPIVASQKTTFDETLPENVTHRLKTIKKKLLALRQQL